MKSFGKVKTEENRVFEFKFGILELDNLKNLFGLFFEQYHFNSIT